MDTFETLYIIFASFSLVAQLQINLIISRVKAV